MKVSKYKHYIKDKGAATNEKSLVIANALFAELMNYGIILSDELKNRIAQFKPKKAAKLAGEIAKMYVAPDLNPPLFKDWEERTFYSIDEFIVQIFGYIFQLSGNDLADPNFSAQLKSKIDFKKFKTLECASDEETQKYVDKLFGANVSQDRGAAEKLKSAAKMIDLKFLGNIRSDEARIAVLLALSKKNDLQTLFINLKCKPADVMRYAAAKLDFANVKLPAGVKYSNLAWSERTAILNFLESFDFDYLSEAMGMNRGAWTRFFNHIHLLTQKGFPLRFENVWLAYYISARNRLDAAPKVTKYKLNKLVKENVVSLTDEGSLVYRTFASRMEKAINEKDFKAIKKMGSKRPGYILRNLSSVSNGIGKKNESAFVSFVRELLDKASPDVLFSLLSIGVNSDYRIIDVKGDTIVEKANYCPLLGEIQKEVERTVYARFGFEGKVEVQPVLEKEIVPFLSKNANVRRGSKLSVANDKYLYFFMHWVQRKHHRTDLDHSYLSLDKDLNACGMVSFRSQANEYIAQSGDITSAPAPSGATEYGRITLAKIPKNVKYIVPAINVYAGDCFADNESVKCGFFPSNDPEFALKRKHNTYVLDQPASVSIPFVFDVDKKEIVFLDINKRETSFGTVDQHIPMIKQVVSASGTKNYVSIGRLAKILSGEKDETSLIISNKGNRRGIKSITPESLFSLFSEQKAEKTAKTKVDEKLTVA